MAFSPAKANLKEGDGWMAVPQFGGWEKKADRTPDYSMVFTRARANRKQQKVDVSRVSIGQEKEFLNFPRPRTEEDSAMRRRRLFSCLSCSVKN
ncbi:hypothetical protein HPP92_026730 [Vanilla planifolia]|uniref:RIN4 pathogenic type III effector avirulence factor Avr cleavage site domain-containing protein n=1 Tax=Vanilla planifolia TaxID=51239 RepID=A0A835RWQ8_VANPL|nr:hypothetical protein HPP92_026730 [Vanilla planifolia]KAG0497009.1 hypothetical protein HPP92_001700 [Vanilla planifolia]